MTPEQFAYWMQGFVELTKGQEPTADQWKSIREHLGAVFKKVTPPVGDAVKQVSSDLQKYLREIEERNKQQPHPQQTPPAYPWNQAQPYWLQPNLGFPPGTVIC